MTPRRTLASLAAIAILLVGPGVQGQGPCQQSIQGTVASLAVSDCIVTVTGDVNIPVNGAATLEGSDLVFTGPWTLRALGALELVGSTASVAGGTIVIEPGATGRIADSRIEGHQTLLVRTTSFTLDDVAFDATATGLEVQAAQPTLAGLEFMDSPVGLRVAGAARPILRGATFSGIAKPIDLVPGGEPLAAPVLTILDADLPAGAVAFGGQSVLLRALEMTATVQGSGATGAVFVRAIDSTGNVRGEASAAGNPLRAALVVPVESSNATMTRSLGPYRYAAVAGAHVAHLDASDVPDAITLFLSSDEDTGASAQPAWPPNAVTQLGTRPGYSADGRVGINWLAPDEQQGHANRALARFEVLLDCTGACPPAATTRLQHEAMLTGLPDGLHRMRVRAVDLAGNSAVTDELAVLVDGARPALESAILDVMPVPSNAYAADHRVSATASDTGSGLALVTSQLNGGAIASYAGPIAITQDGNHTILFRAVDRAGNAREVTVVTARDTAAPLLAAALTPGPPTGNGIGWSAKPLNLTASARDAVTGVASLRLRVDQGSWRPANGTQRLDLAPGQHTVDVEAKDRVGNLVLTSLVAGFDSSLPSVTFTTPPPSGRNGWALEPVVVGIEAKDDVSGLRQAEARVSNGTWSEFRSPMRLLRSGNHLLEVRATDNAGNTVNASRPVRIDLEDPVPPQPAWTLTSLGEVRGDWSAAPAFDAPSGIARVLIEEEFQGAPRLVQEAAPGARGATLVGLPDGEHRLRIRVEDVAGRSAATPWEPVQVSGATSAPEVARRVARGLALLAPPPVEGLREVRFYVDGELLAAVGEEPFLASWDTQAVADGTYQVRTVATDGDGQLHQSVVQYEVRNGYAATVADNLLPVGAATASLLAAASASIAAMVARRRLA